MIVHEGGLMRKPTTLITCLSCLLLWLLGCTQWAELPGDYHVLRHSSVEVSVAKISGPAPLIPPKVVGLWWDESYLVGECHPLKRRSPNSPQDTSMIPDLTIRNYWIIDVEREESFGPLSHASMQEKCKALGILPSAVTFRPPPFTRKEE